MRLFWLICLLSCLGFTGCAASPVEVSRPAVDVRLTEAEPGKWRLDYVFERPVHTFIFRKSYADTFRQGWAPLWETPAIVRRSGLDTVYFPRPTTKASFWLDPAEVHQSIDGFLTLEPHGTAISTWQFVVAVVTDRATIANGRSGLSRVMGYTPEARFTLSSPRPKQINSTVIFGDVQLASFEETYVYVGDLRPMTTQGFTAIIDGDVPPAIGRAFEQDMSHLFAYFRARFESVETDDPMVLLHYNSAGSLRGFEGRVAEDGTLVLSLTGRLSGRDLNRHRAELLHFFAHEIAHNQQDATIHAQPEARDRWISEGFAEAMAYDALRAEGLASVGFVQRAYAQDFQHCARALNRRSLHQSAGEAHYSCGNLIAVMIGAAAPEHNLYGVWQELKLAQARAGEEALGYTRVLACLTDLGVSPQAVAGIKALITERQSDSGAALQNAMRLAGLPFEVGAGQTLKTIELP